MTDEQPKDPQQYGYQRLSREHFDPGTVPQDAIYGSKLGIFVAENSGTQAITASVTFVKTFNGTLFQRGNISLNASNIVTVEEDGVYAVTGQLWMEGQTSTALNELFIEVASPGVAFAAAGANPRIAELGSQIVGTPFRANCTNPLYAARKGWQFRMAGFCAATGTLATFGVYTGFPTSWMAIHKVCDLGKRLYSDVGSL